MTFSDGDDGSSFISTPTCIGQLRRAGKFLILLLVLVHLRYIPPWEENSFSKKFSCIGCVRSGQCDTPGLSLVTVEGLHFFERCVLDVLAQIKSIRLYNHMSLSTFSTVRFYTVM